MTILPSEVRLLQDKSALVLNFNNVEYVLSAEYLRVHSPSAQVRGHGVGNEVLQVGKKDVLLLALSVAGQYALKLTFSDGHDSGLYDWAYLYELASQYDEKWAAYLTLLKEANASR